MRTILCGSLVSFIKDEVIAESAPLHGRSNLELKPRLFNYLETAEFLEGFPIEEKAICYGLSNGVATGQTKNGEIASYIGSDDVTFPLKVLVGAEILEKRTSSSANSTAVLEYSLLC